MTALSEMYQHVMQELPGCSKIMIMRTVVEVIRDWCMRTQAWEEDLDAVDIEDGVKNYDLDSPIEDTQVIGLVFRPSDDVGVKNDGRLLSAGTEYTISMDKDIITLYSEPTADNSAALEMPAALALTIAATEDSEVPDRLYTDWHQVWARGVMSRLMAMRKKKWTDKDTARLYDHDYRDGINRAIIERTRGRTNRPLKVQHPAAFA